MWSSRILLLGLLAGNAAAAGDGFMIGAGVETDTDDGISATVFGGLGLSADTWLSAGIAKSSVDLIEGRELDTLYADVELDHYFDPIGIRVGAAYWGDSDILESNDWRASLYWRSDAVTVAADYEYRDFDLTIPGNNNFASRKLMFDADGIGATVRIKTSEHTSLNFKGIKYDYSVPFRSNGNTDAARLFSVSRLSLINTLVDHRASASLSIEQGLKHWEIDFTTWEGAIDGSRTNSSTLRYLMPMSNKTDIEFGLGYDDSELYGDVAFFSLYLYFYGAD
jgi:hypothetical protein